MCPHIMRCTYALHWQVWCHRYYLRNLCDEERFPDWPIVDHVPFLQARLPLALPRRRLRLHHKPFLCCLLRAVKPCLLHCHP